MHATLRESTSPESASPSFCDGIKINRVEKAFLLQQFTQAPSSQTRVVLQMAVERVLCTFGRKWALRDSHLVSVEDVIAVEDDVFPRETNDIAEQIEIDVFGNSWVWMTR